MTQQQYEAAQTIMQFSRIFADAMRECMKNSGLLDDGYELHLDVDVVELTHQPDDPIICTAKIHKNVQKHEDWMDDRITHFKFWQEGWRVNADPVIKTGNVPPEVRISETASRVYGSGKKTEKPFAPDGYWISRYDCPDPVDGGM